MSEILVLVLHPDDLITPTFVSELKCPCLVSLTISASFGRLVSADIGALMKNFVTNKHLAYLQLC